MVSGGSGYEHSSGPEVLGFLIFTDRSGDDSQTMPLVDKVLEDRPSAEAAEWTACTLAPPYLGHRLWCRAV